MNANIYLINPLLINSNSTTKKSTSNVKDISNALFATQLENVKKTDTYSYVREIEKCYSGTKVTVKSMTAGDVKRYYEEWKDKPINYSGFSHEITVSPKVLEKMEKDPVYAEKMMRKIQKAATPEGFENATLYEYKVFVRDDGEIETMACADMMNGNKKKIYNDDEDKDKAEKRIHELIYWNKRIYEERELQTLSEEKLKNTLLYNNSSII